MKLDDALKLAKKGERVYADYMSPGWAVAWVKQAKGFFNVNPHTGSTYGFMPDERDRAADWNTQPKKQWMVIS